MIKFHHSLNYAFYQNWFTRPAEPSGDSINEVSSEVVQESYDGPSIQVSATVTSDAAHSSTHNNLQVCGEDCDQESEEDITLWCYCQKDLPEEELVGYDNPECARKWFHMSYLQLTLSTLPRGKWYCPDCHKTRSKQCKGKGKAKLRK